MCLGPLGVGRAWPAGPGTPCERRRGSGGLGGTITTTMAVCLCNALCPQPLLSARLSNIIIFCGNFLISFLLFLDFSFLVRLFFLCCNSLTYLFILPGEALWSPATSERGEKITCQGRPGAWLELKAPRSWDWGISSSFHHDKLILLTPQLIL